MATGQTIQNSLNVQTRSFRVVISRTEEDDGYIADIPSLDTCFAFGDTVEEAMANLQEALEGTLETMIEHGWPIPDESKNMEMTITIPLPSSLALA
jgi:predicted RNase H-like HicB family nuclease